MSIKRAFANADIVSIQMGIPDGHRHIRTLIETTSGETFIFQEATIANIVRAYTIIKTHPQKKAVELKQTLISERKEGYAEHQLLETDTEEGMITRKLAQTGADE